MSKIENNRIVQSVIDTIDYFIEKLDKLYKKYNLTGSITWKVGK